MHAYINFSYFFQILLILGVILRSLKHDELYVCFVKMLHCVKDISFIIACSWQLKATNKVATSKEEEKKRRGGKVERYRISQSQMASS